MRARTTTISRKVRSRFYYTVPVAGAKVGLGRSQSYREAGLGNIPIERKGKLLLVPRREWDRQVKGLLRGRIRGRAPNRVVAQVASRAASGAQRLESLPPSPHSPAPNGRSLNANVVDGG